jgi:hypothetical protein
LRRLLLTISSALIVSGISNAAQDTTGIKQMIFEEQKIEGKIRRPQLVLIKADQRPDFQPVVLQSLGKSSNIAGQVRDEVLEKSPYKGAFQLDGTRIIYYSP